MTIIPMPLDLLSHAIDGLRPILADNSQPVKARMMVLWATAKKARGLGSSDQVHAEFMEVAVETNLINRNGRYTCTDEKHVRKSARPYGREDVAHVITWALRGWNPFEKGPLK
jgi:hypothetical protein